MRHVKQPPPLVRSGSRILLEGGLGVEGSWCIGVGLVRLRVDTNGPEKGSSMKFVLALVSLLSKVGGGVDTALTEGRVMNGDGSTGIGTA